MLLVFKWTWQFSSYETYQATSGKTTLKSSYVNYHFRKQVSRNPKIILGELHSSLEFVKVWGKISLSNTTQMATDLWLDPAEMNMQDVA